MEALYLKSQKYPHKEIAKLLSVARLIEICCSSEIFQHGMVMPKAHEIRSFFGVWFG